MPSDERAWESIALMDAAPRLTPSMLRVSGPRLPGLCVPHGKRLPLAHPAHAKHRGVLPVVVFELATICVVERISQAACKARMGVGA